MWNILENAFGGCLKLNIEIKITMFKITSGRRKERAIWDYFAYDSIVNKSKCSVCYNNLSG